MARRRPRSRDWLVRLGEGLGEYRRRQLGNVITEVAECDATGRTIMLRQRLRTECLLDGYLIAMYIDQSEHQAGMKFTLAWLRARCGVKIRDPYSTAKADGVPTDHVGMNMESERVLKQADKVLSREQKAIIIRVCCENTKAGGTDRIETLRRGLHRLAKLWGYL